MGKTGRGKVKEGKDKEKLRKYLNNKQRKHQQKLQITKKIRRMMQNETNITDNRKTRNKNKNWSYNAVVKGITNKDKNKKVISIQEIKENLVKDNVSHSYITSQSVLIFDYSVCSNSSDQTEFVKQSSDTFPSQYDELFHVLENLQNEFPVNGNPVSSAESRIISIFNLSNRVLSEGEIKALEKGLDLAPIPRKNNEYECE